MQSRLGASIAQTSITASANPAKITSANIKVVRDVPLATTFYYPAKLPQSRVGVTHWRVYPYIGQRANGDTYFRLKVNLSIGGWAKSWFFEEMHFVIDGADYLPLDLREAHAKQDAWTQDSTSYDFGGSQLQSVVRRLASAKEAWLIAYADGDRFRSNVRIKPEQLETFRLILAEYDRLREQQQHSP